MSNFPQFRYTKKQVLKAGRALEHDLIWSGDTAAEIHQIFQIANNWRESHLLPMNSIRREMIGKMRRCNTSGTTAARLKRMPSIRGKLRREPGNLNQMQDLGGCRVIVPTMQSANVLIEEALSNPKNRLRRENDYIRCPKSDGYRCRHLIFDFTPSNKGHEAYRGRRIEVQIRTRLQHSWATAVEAVGFLRNENLKAGEGNADWLRLFFLVSAELANTENAPEPPLSPSHEDRLKEICDLDRKLSAVSELENIRWAMKFTDQQLWTAREKPNYYRIEFDNENDQVNVVPTHSSVEGTKSYGLAEEEEFRSGNSKKTVFVEADKIEDLKDAYPNYFGDVQVFVENLSLLTQGRPAKEYKIPPVPMRPRLSDEPADFQWFTPGRNRRWN